MPDIGTTLHEARLRRKVDIVEVEADTKIRARYLRALEEEEWDLLPGPTYVKTFLRTYGEYLGLDAKLLVEEYKQRYERPTPQELTPFSTNLGSRRERRRARGPVIAPGPGVVLAVCVVLLIGILAAIGTFWSDPADEETVQPPASTPAQSAGDEERDRERATERRRNRRPRTVRVRVVAEGVVNVCLVSRTGRRLIDSVDLQPGQTSRRFTGRRFRVAFGNGGARMRVGDRSYPVADLSGPVGYDIRPGRTPRRLPASQLPSCA